MTRFRSIKNSFLGGQISPTALGRTEHPQYPHSCELLLNMIPMLSGGAYRRPGTMNVDTYIGANNYVPRIFPFVDSTNAAYCILLGKDPDLGAFAKSYRATGNKWNDVSTSTITGTPPYAIATTANYLSSGTDDELQQVQYCQSVDKMYLVHPNQKPQIITRTAVDAFTLTDFDNGLSGQALVNAYPYLNQNATAITLSSSVDTVGSGRTLTASAPLFVSTQVGTIFVINMGSGTVGAVQVTAYSSSTSVTVKVLVALGASGGASAAKATWWESAWSPTRGWPRAICIFQQRLALAGNAHQPDTIWFSGTANYGQMSIIGSTPALLKSTTTGYYAVNSTVCTNQTDDSPGDGLTTGPIGIQPFRITLTQNQLDQIQWLSPDKELLIGTRSQEYITSPQNGSFDVGNSPVVLQSKYGSDWIPAVRIGYELIVPMATSDELVAYQYNYIDASFFAEPVQLFFDQYPKPEGNGYSPGRRKIRHFDWDVSRHTLWVMDTAGNFYGMTRDRKLGVTMWHTHQMGGYDTTKGQLVITRTGITATDPACASCDGSVISFAVVPNPKSGVNDVWMVVKRTVGGLVNWQLERMIGKNVTRDTVFTSAYPGVTATEPYLVDGCVSQTDIGDGTFIYSNLSSLNGYAALTGNYYSPTTGLFKITAGAVSGGSATVNKPVPSDYGNGGNWVVLGLMFNSIIQPVRIDQGSVIGTSQGAIMRIHRAIIKFYKTICAKVGSPPTNDDDLSALETIYFRDSTAAIGHSPEVFTGDKRVAMPSTYERQGYVYIEQDQPMPFTVISIVAEGEEYDT